MTTSIAPAADLGLDEAEAQARLLEFGPNRLVPERARPPLIAWLARMIADPMVILLAAAGSTYAVLGDRFDAAITLGALVPVFLVNAILESRAERALEELEHLAAPTARVLRGGRERQIPAYDVVPGDIAFVQEGDIVPADGEMIAGTNLSFDESSLTGESAPVTHGADEEPAIFAGTTLVAGRGTMRVTQTGARTSYGRIGTLIADVRPARTPIETAIGKLVTQVGAAVIVVCVGIVFVERAHGLAWAGALIAGVSLAMAALPEELPMVYTLYLALGALRLSRDHALVRRLPSVETLGSTNVICADKTGTLTLGRLDLVGVAAFGAASERDVVTVALLASDPAPFDPVDRAIDRYADAIGADRALAERGIVVDDVPFAAERGYAQRRLRLGSEDVLAVKGALEVVLARGELDAPERAAIERAAEGFASEGKRVLAIARADGGGNVRPIGLLAFADAERPGIARELAICRDAGIRVVMITGDHPTTALAVARSLGFIVERPPVIGSELEGMDEANLADAVAHATVFARTRPEQKLRIVRALHARGDVVAMTGDGTNDAPALREADIGIAMGERGTAVARSAADLVLLDDDFSTIVRAIRDGRRIFDNLRRAVRYLLAFHLPLLAAGFLLPLIGAPLMLLPVHLVWLELIVHPTSSLVFEAEPATEDIMRRAPRPKSQGLLDRSDWLRPTALGLTLAAGVLGIYLYELHAGTPVATSRAAALVTMIFGQIILVFAERAAPKPIWRAPGGDARVLVPIVGATLASLAAAVYVAPLAKLLELAAPQPRHVLAALAIAAVTTLWLQPFTALSERRA